MSAHMSFSSFVDYTLLKMILAVMRYVIGVVTSPGKLIKFPPTVSLVRCVSAFCGRISAAIIPYVTIISAGTLSLGIKKMVFVPDVIIVPTPCNSRPVSFANELSLMDLVIPLIICLYSSDYPVVGSMTTFTWWCPFIFFSSTATCYTIGSTRVPCYLVLYRFFAHGRS